jgi:hypothetical protein
VLLPDYAGIRERWSVQDLDVNVGHRQSVLPLGKRGDVVL